MSLHLVPRQLRYVLAVAEHGSVQAASRALGIAASAIDRHIKSMEEASQSPLFERLPRGMKPTAAGETVIVLARRWQADAERLDSGLKEMRGQEHGTVRLAAMDSLANGVLPELVAWVHKEHPRIHLDIDIMTPAQAAQALDQGTVDLVLAFNLPNGRFQHRTWEQDLPFGCVVRPAHPLAEKPRVTLAMLSEIATASQSALLPIRKYLDSRHGWLFAENAPILVTNSLQLLKQAVLLSDMAILTSQLDVLPELEDGALTFLPIDETGLRPQNIVLAVDTRRPLVRATRVVAERLSKVLPDRLGRLGMG